MNIFLIVQVKVATWVLSGWNFFEVDLLKITFLKFTKKHAQGIYFDFLTRFTLFMLYIVIEKYNCRWASSLV